MNRIIHGIAHIVSPECRWEGVEWTPLAGSLVLPYNLSSLELRFTAVNVTDYKLRCQAKFSIKYPDPPHKIQKLKDWFSAWAIVVPWRNKKKQTIPVGGSKTFQTDRGHLPHRSGDYKLRFVLKKRISWRKSKNLDAKTFLLKKEGQ